MKGTLPIFLVAALALCLVGTATADTVTFDFNSIPEHTPLPLTYTVDGLTAYFTATSVGDPFGMSVQSNAAFGYLPMPYFPGNFLYPNSLSRTTLTIQFSAMVTGISFTFATIELPDNVEGATSFILLNAYDGSTQIGSATGQGDWIMFYPTGTLTFSSPGIPFDSVEIYVPGNIDPNQRNGTTNFLADDITVTTASTNVPEPGCVALLGVGLGLLASIVTVRRRMKSAHLC